MDAAAARRDLHVIEARSAHLLLIRARATEDRVRVRIDETRHKNATSTVDFLSVAIALAELGLWTNLRDAIVDDRHGRTR